MQGVKIFVHYVNKKKTIYTAYIVIIIVNMLKNSKGTTLYKDIVITA